MLRIQARIQGHTPLMMDCMSDAVLEGIRTGVRVSCNKDVPAKQQAEAGLYKDNDGLIAIPVYVFLACLREAGRHFKIGSPPRQITKGEGETSLYSFLTIPGAEFLYFEGTPEWEVDKRRGGADKGKSTCIVRAKFHKWSFRVTMEVDETEISESMFKSLVAVAGKKKGLCAFRPTCGGPFGQFRIAEWASEKIELDGEVADAA